MTNRLIYGLYHLAWSGLDLLFPPSCGGCGKLGTRWCQDCKNKVSFLPQPICEKCGEPVIVKGRCDKCRKHDPGYELLRSCFVYTGPVRTALLKMKYHQQLGLGEVLAEYMAIYLQKCEWELDCIVPIPLSEQRYKERGYNQVNVIAHPLSLMISWKYSTGALKRIKHTASQVGLSGGERRKNVLGAFEAKPKIVANKNILLIDDIATTGATIEAASNALLAAGAKKVRALTFARALPNYGLDNQQSVQQFHPSV